MEEKCIPIAVDPWAESFDRLMEILNPFGVSRDDIADCFFIKNHMHEYKDLLTPDQVEEVFKLTKHIHH